MATQSTFFDGHPVAFIGGGNMAGAMLGGLRQQGVPGQQLMVVEPHASARQALAERLGVQTLAQADAELADAALVVWAVKPQVLQEVVALTRPFLSAQVVHLSIAAGVRTDSLQGWLGRDCVVRAMPNTPALIGQGVSGLYACPQVSALQKAWVQTLMGALGQTVWVDKEALIDAVTAVSGSGPAYVYYFADAMVQAGVKLGLSPEQAKQLTLATFAGTTALALASPESLGTLREQVTSKGGTTFAAISAMQSQEVAGKIEEALFAAAARAVELGHELGSIA